MKPFFLLICLTSACLLAGAQQKVIGDCTVTFIITGGTEALKADLKGASKKLYVKGKMSRTDVINPLYQQSVIYDNTTGSAVILQQMGANKYMSRLTPEIWNQSNANYQGINFVFSTDTKTILGYECKKGTATLKNGSIFTFYYATAIIPSVTENPLQFKDIPGFVLEYTIAGKDGAGKISYTATKIDFSPVPASMFDIPTSGYLVR